MPLVERYHDWACSTNEGSPDDPRTLAFDHRVEAGAIDYENGMAGNCLAGLEKCAPSLLNEVLLIQRSNIRATCLITTLNPAYGWIGASNGEWIYDSDAPTVQSKPTLGAHFERNLGPCIQHDQLNVMDTLTRNPNVTFNVEDVEVRRALGNMQWPADSKPQESDYFVSRFSPQDQYIAGSEYCSGYHVGNGLVATAGHCLQRTRSRLKVVFGWSGDVRNKRFRSSDVFEVEK